MKEMNLFTKNILIELINKEIEELQNHEFTFHSEREISHSIPNRSTVFDWFTHGQFYCNNITERIIVSEEEARYNREAGNPMEMREAEYIYKRIELLKDIKKLLEGNKICLEEL